MRALIILGFITVVIVIGTVSTSRGDGDATDSATGQPQPVDETTEPITGTAAVTKGGELPAHDPFAPYEIGGPNAAWPYERLTPDERAVADRGLDEDQTGTQNGFAAASRALAGEAKGNAAAIQLGADENLESMGVVP